MELKVFRNLCEWLKKDTCGDDLIIQTPFGRRRMIYADHTASNRAISTIEQYIVDEVLPKYGNIHSVSNVTARQSNHYREEARNIIRAYFNASYDDAIIFSGNGATGAINCLVNILEKGKWRASFTQDLKPVSETRWGSFICNSCELQLESENAVKAHLFKSEGCVHVRPKVKTVSSVFLLDPTLHHSSCLPFRELSRLRNGEIDPDGTTYKFAFEYIAWSPEGLADIKDLESKLNHFAREDFAQIYVIMSGCSNVTGIFTPVELVTGLTSQYNAFCFWDLASAVGHMKIDVSSMDAAFVSPHKLLGGPSTAGVLIVKKKCLVNEVPGCPGGGVIRVVTQAEQLYSEDNEHREEAGTPNIISCIRTGLVFRLANIIPLSLTHERETLYLNYILKELTANAPNVQFLGPLTTLTGLDNPAQILTPRKALFSFLIKYNSFEIAPGTQSRIVEEKYMIYPNTRSSGGLYIHHNFVSNVLNDLFGIQARPGCACAGPLSLKLLGFDETLSERLVDCLEETSADIFRPGFVRISLHYTMSWQDIYLITEAVKWVAEHAWKLLPVYNFNKTKGEWTANFARSHEKKERQWLSILNLDPNGIGLITKPVVAAAAKGAIEAQSDFKKDPKTIVGATQLFPKTITAEIVAGRSKLKKAAPRAPKASTNSQPGWVKTNRGTNRNGDVDTSPQDLPKPESFTVEPSFTVETPALETPFSPAEPEDTGILARSDMRISSTMPIEIEDYILQAERFVELIQERATKSNLVNIDGLRPSFPAKYADLLWFALPCDAALSMDLLTPNKLTSITPEVALDTNSPYFPILFGDENIPRPNNSVFETLRCWQDTVPVWPLAVKMKTRSESQVSSECRADGGSPHISPQALNDDLEATDPIATEMSCKKSAADLIEICTNDGCSVENKQCSDCSAAIVEEDVLFVDRAAAAALTSSDSLASAMDMAKENDEQPERLNKEFEEESFEKTDYLAIPRGLRNAVGKSMQKFNMLEDGDRVAVALSGGKDSMSLLHVMLSLKGRIPIDFDLCAITVDPMTPEYNPEPLSEYVKSLGIPFYLLKYPIIQIANERLQGTSICSFCARFKRGLIYTCMKTHGYNTLALGHHLDDVLETFFMSAFYNGALFTLRANYTATEHGVKVIRPLILARERALTHFAKENNLPVIADNCPACFAAPTERLRMKHLVAEQEHLYPSTVSSLGRALMPLIANPNLAASP